MSLTNAEQYLLEMINRTRLDPLAEAARFGIDLNDDLPAGTLGSQVRQVLAPNVLIESTAASHSAWMLDADVFSHIESDGSGSADRATAAGYRWSHVAENIAWWGTTGSLDLGRAIAEQHRDLFLSETHRVNMLGDVYREVGLGQERGYFNYQGHTYNSSMVTEVFGTSGSKVFVTGVAYRDRDGNDFYSIGEGISGVVFRAQGGSARTLSAGGYALAVTPDAEVAVTGRVGTKDFSATLDMDHGNVKLDVVGGTTFFTSGNITLDTGIQEVLLLGSGVLSATGNDRANVLEGNRAANLLDGRAGDDVLVGNGGKDRLLGGDGADTLVGDSGKDVLTGGEGRDRLQGGSEADRLYGGQNADLLIGGAGSDSFFFNADTGADRIVDFSVAADDRLVLDDALWGGGAKSAVQVVTQFGHIVQGEVELQFSPDDRVHLTGVTSFAYLARHIDII